MATMGKLNKVALVLIFNLLLIISVTIGQDHPDSEVELIPTNNNNNNNNNAVTVVKPVEEKRPPIVQQKHDVNQLGSQIYYDYTNYGKWQK